MKKNIIVITVLIFIFSSYALANFNVNSEIVQVEKLMNERLKIINDFLYNEQSFIRLKRELEKIEKKSLLIKDLDILANIINNPTSFEHVKSVKIENVIESNYNDDTIEIIAMLKWYTEGYSGNDKILNKYKIKCIIENEKLYLIELVSMDVDTIDEENSI